MVARLRAGEADVVFGSRFLDARTRPGWSSGSCCGLAVQYSNVTTGVHLTDAHNGLRALNRAAAARLRIRQNRMAHASEIIEQIGERPGSAGSSSRCTSSTPTTRGRRGSPLFNAVNILTELIYR